MLLGSSRGDPVRQLDHNAVGQPCPDATWETGRIRMTSGHRSHLRTIQYHHTPMEGITLDLGWNMDGDVARARSRLRAAGGKSYQEVRASSWGHDVSLRVSWRPSSGIWDRDQAALGFDLFIESVGVHT